MATYTSILLLCLGLLQLLTAQERQAVWQRHQEKQDRQFGSHSRWEVRCSSSCSVDLRRQLYTSLGCTMLKDYSSHSHVSCPGSVHLQVWTQ